MSKEQKASQKPAHALQAVGCFQGELKISANHIQFVSEDGWKVLVQGVGPQVLCQIHRNPAVLEGFFTLWPRPRGVELRTFNASPHPSLQPGIMKIIGRIAWIEEGKISLKISDRHHLSTCAVKFTVWVTAFRWFQPDAKAGQLWQVQATREGESWSVLDGERLSGKKTQAEPKATPDDEVKQAQREVNAHQPAKVEPEPVEPVESNVR